MNAKIRKVLALSAGKLGLRKDDVLIKYQDYLKVFKKHAFSDTKCRDYEQYEAVITRWYHTIEKGLSYNNYRPGFGKDNVQKLLTLMEQYAEQYDTEAFFYRTALSCLHEYIRKNKEYGLINYELDERINNLKGIPNEFGGVISVTKTDAEKLRNANYEVMVKNRHSIREFSEEPVDIEVLKEAIRISQNTPSACNRQGWKTRIIADKAKISDVLQWQNGNRGFGDKIDKLLLITCDVRYFNKKREIFQPFIDGGMYAQSLINALSYKGVGSVPLSASLTTRQEKNVRKIIGLNDSEVLILFIGAGNYPEGCKTPRSERKKQIQIDII